MLFQFLFRLQNFWRSTARTILNLLCIAACQIGHSQEVRAAQKIIPAASEAEMSDGSLVKVNFPSAPIQAIIPFYTSLTKKKLILDSSLKGELLRIISPEPLTRNDAIAFVEATLLLNGYALVEVDATTSKLINSGAGKSPTSDGLRVYNDIRDLPSHEEICHYILTLRHISGDEASKAFQEVIKMHPYGAMSVVSNNTALIITENSATIRTIHQIAQVIDVPSESVANEMIRLERSDVELVAEIINEIFGEEEKLGITPSEVRASTAEKQGAAGAGGQGETAGNPGGSKVKVFPYRRTNELLVIGRPVDITYIKGLVEKLDRQNNSTDFVKRRLKWLKVEDFISVAYNALAKDTDIQGSDGTALSGGGRRKSRQPGGDADALGAGAMGGGNAGDPSRGLSAMGANNAVGGMNTRTGGSNAANRSLLSAPEEAGSPESMVVGKTLLIADPQSNSLVVSGSPEHVARIDQLIEELDVKPQQIYISAIIGQLSLGQNYNYGFDFLKLLDDFSLRQTNSSFSSSSSSSGLVGSSSGSAGVSGSSAVNFSWNRLNLYGQIGSLSSYIKMIDSNNDFKILATPSVYAKNAAKSVISSGQKIAVPAQILSNSALQAGVINNSVSVDFRDVLLKLEVIPLINSDDEVTLRIAQINDNIVGSQNISGNTVPTIGTQQLVTEVAVKNNATVVLGGLITERTTKEGRGGMYLRRIPVIKNLFGTTTTEHKREELLIFIQPHIIKDDDSNVTPNSIESDRASSFQDTKKFGEILLEDVPKALPFRG